MAGAALGEPGLAIATLPVSALAGSVTEEGVNSLILLWERRRDRIQRLADEAETSEPHNACRHVRPAFMKI